MNTCPKCNVKIYDSTGVCPLCGSAVTRSGSEAGSAS